MIKTILFDADGVVVTPPQVFSKTLVQKYNIPMEIASDFFTGAFQSCLVGKDDLKKEIAPYIKKWGLKLEVDQFLLDWFESENYLDKEMLSYIDQLKSEGIICVLATNQEKYRTNFMRDDMKLGEVFNHIFSSAYIGLKKPHPDFFINIINRFNLNTQEVLFVDDLAKNVQAAETVGIKSNLYKKLESFKRFVSYNK